MIILPQRAALCHVNPLAERLGHRERLPTFSLLLKCQDCGHGHDIMEGLAELVDIMVSESGLPDSDEQEEQHD